jgi:hypothetical protein
LLTAELANYSFHLLFKLLLLIRMFSKVLLLMLLPVGAASAQAGPVSMPAPTPRKVTIYLAADGGQLPSAEGADHRAEITMRDSVSGLLKEYYPSGKLWKIVPYAHVGRGIRHGVEMSYDESGQLRRRQEFVAGMRQGELQVFDGKGTVSRTTTFDHDKPVAQQCFTPAGQAKECKTEKMLPEYPGGTAGLITAITQATVMPHDELAKWGFGTVLLKFVVDANATIVGATVVEAPSPAMGQAALAALGRIKPFLAPGRVDEEPRAVLYSLPIKLGHPASGWTIVHDTSKTEHQPKTTFLEAD